jgi:hypothetical protein
MATTRSEFRSVSEPTLYVGLELSKKTWKVGLSSGFGVTPWVQSVPVGTLRRSIECWRAGGDGSACRRTRGS